LAEKREASQKGGAPGNLVKVEEDGERERARRPKAESGSQRFQAKMGALSMMRSRAPMSREETDQEQAFLAIGAWSST
jgi:hypothetical protein